MGLLQVVLFIVLLSGLNNRIAFSLRTKELLNLYSGHLLYIPKAVRQNAIFVLTWEARYTSRLFSGWFSRYPISACSVHSGH